MVKLWLENKTFNLLKPKLYMPTLRQFLDTFLFVYTNEFICQPWTFCSNYNPSGKNPPYTTMVKIFPRKSYHFYPIFPINVCFSPICELRKITCWFQFWLQFSLEHDYSAYFAHIQILKIVVFKKSIFHTSGAPETLIFDLLISHFYKRRNFWKWLCTLYRG